MSVVRNAEGQPFSKWKPADKFRWIFETSEHGDFMDHCEEEYEFCRERKWRFDFAWPSLMLAVEIDGAGPGRFGRHQRLDGIVKDNEKLNHAVVSGWRVLRFCSAQLNSRQKVENAVDHVIECLVRWD